MAGTFHDSKYVSTTFDVLQETLKLTYNLIEDGRISSVGLKVGNKEEI